MGGCLLAAEPLAPKVGERNVDGIRDNSFLIEEAYNQEKGVVQHIFTAMYALDHAPGPEDQLWNLVFTQEWPLFSQTHQLSYTIPYNFARTGGQGDNGFGEVLLNYRYQAYFNSNSLMAVAPRASLVLPTGDKDLGFRADTVGAQFNLPFSTAIGDDWFVNLNAGLTYLPNASSEDRGLVYYNLGSSVIYAATRNFHFLVEWVGYWFQIGEPGRSNDYEFVALISPGFRRAFNFANDSQLVLGVAAPIGLTDAAPDIGAFFYVSFEHYFQKVEK